ncbi:MAG: hypothetical protein ACYC1Z_13610 [Georgenia sp.]
MRHRAALVAAIALVSCANLPTRSAPLTPQTQDRLLPVQPWPELDRWWQEVRACTGKTSSPVTRPPLYLWSDTALTVDRLTPLDGAYLLHQRLIIVRRYDPRIIRHEMVHALLAPDTSHAAWVGVACGAILRWP